MKTCAVILLIGLSLGNLSAAPKILINEVHINPPGTDGNYEFIELVSVESTTGAVLPNQSCNGLTLLLVDTSGGTAGEVQEAWSLNGMSTGANGLLLLGDGYDNTPKGGPWSNLVLGLTTSFGDPVSVPANGTNNLGTNDIAPNPGLDAGFTLMLVSNYIGIGDPGAGFDGSDLDSNDDRILGNYVKNPQGLPPDNSAVTTPPYTTIVDSVGVPERRLTTQVVRQTYATASISVGTGIPGANTPATAWDVDSIARKRLANGNVDVGSTSTSWYGGAMTGPSASVSYDPTASVPVHYFGLKNAANVDAPGEVTPGQPNLIIAPDEAVIRINEVSINPSREDDGYEYVEIISTNRTNASLAGYSLLVVDSSTTAGGVFIYDNMGQITNTLIPHAAVGEVLEIWSLDGFVTGSNGLCLLGNNYSLTWTPFGAYVSPQTSIGNPNGMGNNDLSDNDAFTLLLVKNLPPTVLARNGIVSGTDLDTNDDGLREAAPALTIVDSIGYDEVIGAGYATTLGRTYSAGANIVTAGPEFPVMDNLSRLPATNTLNAANWYGGQYGGRDQISLGFKQGPKVGTFVGAGTPGQPNLSAAPPAATNIRINEVHFGPAAGSGGAGYVEVRSTNDSIALTSELYLLVIDNSPPNIGTVETVVDLRGQSTGTNGLAIFGDGMEEATSPWNAAVPPTAVRDDPQSFDASGNENTNFNIGPTDLRTSNGRTILLVSSFTGTQGMDLDADNDGTFEATPWTTQLDSISFGPATHAGVAAIGTPGYTLGNLSRRTSQTSGNTSSQWYYGEIPGTLADQTQTVYTSNYHGSFKGAASPGRPNHAGPSLSTPILINELHMNPPGNDVNSEFIEIISSTTQAQSTNGYTLLLIDSSTGSNNTGNVGTILEVWSLDGLTTGSNGLLLLGDGYPNSVPYTGSLAPSLLTTLADPPGLDAEDIGANSSNGALSLLLVKDFTGVVDTDIDTVGDYTVPPQSTEPGDGVIDLSPLPWTTIEDAVGLRFWNATPAGAPVTPARLEGVVYGGVDLSQTNYTPDNLSRKRGFLTPKSSTGSYGGDVILVGMDNTLYDPTQKFPVGFTGKVTPGNHNVASTTWDGEDDDKDGVVNLIEDATNMNPSVMDVPLLPQVGTLDVNGTLFPTFTYTRHIAATPFAYVVQSSTDLQIWTTSNTVQVSSVSDPNGVTQSVIVRPTDAYFNGLPIDGRRVFMRLKVTR